VQGRQGCKNKLVCSANTCVECTSNAQCPSGTHCKSNACVPAPECESDQECHGKVCQAGKCKACATDAECGPDSTCKAGVCEPAKKCNKDDECADDEDCVKGCAGRPARRPPGRRHCTLATVYFGYDDSTVQSSERDRLTTNVALHREDQGQELYLIGHTDTSGTEEYNIAPVRAPSAGGRRLHGAARQRSGAPPGRPKGDDRPARR